MQHFLRMSCAHILRWKVTKFSVLSVDSDQQQPKPVMFRLLKKTSLNIKFSAISHLEIP